jgi:hypothetical protein
MKTTIDMAREAGFNLNFRITGSNEALDRLVEYVRADEREACAKVIESWQKWGADVALLVKAIRTMSDPVCTASPAAQRQWVGLTDEEMQALWDRYAHMEMMRAIEAKLKEKNT